ncbi:hypothetical protein OXX79_008186 [Metschnikowia pulcherrima]
MYPTSPFYIKYRIKSESAMSQSPISTEERLKAARQRYAELKRKNKLTVVRPIPVKSTDHPDAPQESQNGQASASNQEAYINELQETIDLQKSQIKKLRDENTDLKLERMDLKDKVADLERQLNSLTMQKERNSEKNTEKGLGLQSDPKRDPVGPQMSQSSELPTLGEAKTAEKPVVNTGDYKERILAWKGWQVDMRAWNGCQGAQVVL